MSEGSSLTLLNNGNRPAGNDCLSLAEHSAKRVIKVIIETNVAWKETSHDAADDLDQTLPQATCHVGPQCVWKFHSM
jgi:hypothetical protein